MCANNMFGKYSAGPTTTVSTIPYDPDQMTNVNVK